MRTAHVQVVCRTCEHPYLTRVRGGNTRCPKCSTSRYVRQDQEWEGPVTPDRIGYASRAQAVAARPPVWCDCPFGHEWQSRAKDRESIRCPSCRTKVRVPHRTHANTRPAADRYAVPPPPPVGRRQEVPEPRPVWTPTPQPAPVPGRLLPGLLRPPAPAPAAAPPRAATPAPSAPVRPAPHVATRERDRDRRRRDAVCSMVRSLGGHLLVWYDQPPGACEVLDTSLRTEDQRCPATAARAVVFRSTLHQEAAAYACIRHAEPLAATADRGTEIAASVTFLR